MTQSTKSRTKSPIRRFCPCPILALIDAARDFNRFYTNFLGVLNKAYLDTPFTLTDARVLFEIGSA